MKHIQLTQILLGYVRGRAQRARREGRNELGASALEWAIISAIIVGIAIFVANEIRTRVEQSTAELDGGTDL
ncbi:hypothetical protein BH24ACT12_BH24ACT12_05330 [soil metagenome]